MFSLIGKGFWSMAGICFLISVGIVLAGMNDPEKLASAVEFIQATGRVVIAWIGELWEWAMKGDQEVFHLGAGCL